MGRNSGIIITSFTSKCKSTSWRQNFSTDNKSGFVRRFETKTQRFSFSPSAGYWRRDCRPYELLCLQPTPSLFYFRRATPCADLHVKIEHFKLIPCSVMFPRIFKSETFLYLFSCRALISPHLRYAAMWIKIQKVHGSRLVFNVGSLLPFNSQEPGIIVVFSYGTPHMHVLFGLYYSDDSIKSRHCYRKNA